MRQAEFAAKLGFDQSYISAIELESKGPPSEEFVGRHVERLDLDDAWQGGLRVALHESQRRRLLPKGASKDVYRMFNELRRQFENLHPHTIFELNVASYRRLTAATANATAGRKIEGKDGLTTTRFTGQDN